VARLLPKDDSIDPYNIVITEAGLATLSRNVVMSSKLWRSVPPTDRNNTGMSVAVPNTTPIYANEEGKERNTDCILYIQISFHASLTWALWVCARWGGKGEEKGQHQCQWRVYRVLSVSRSCNQNSLSKMALGQRDRKNEVFFFTSP
jgi:hypothetical protein